MIELHSICKRIVVWYGWSIIAIFIWINSGQSTSFAQSLPVSINAQSVSTESTPISSQSTEVSDQLIEPRAIHESTPQSFKESEQILSDTERWRSPGFRLGLAYHESVISGLDTTPSGEIRGVQIHLGARLEREWSIDGDLRYGVGRGALGGLIFSGMLSGAWHWLDLSVALGVGVAGYAEQADVRVNHYAMLMNEVVASYTLPQKSPPLAQCVGFGPMTGFKLSYQLPLTQITALQLGARVDLARVGCEQDTERVEPDTAQGIVLRQYWTSWSWSWLAGIAWR